MVYRKFRYPGETAPAHQGRPSGLHPGSEERDAEFDLVKDAYYDPDRKGYTAAETLLHDLGGLDHIDLTGRTQKALQLTHMVSLKKHQPMSLLALAMTGRARFTTELAAFDRWYPGTYLQRIKEVRVEVFVDGALAQVRGYISNDGTSLVRFADPDDKRPIDDVRVFAEPDSDTCAAGPSCRRRPTRGTAGASSPTSPGASS
jgi:hypothetical protein